MSDQEENTSSVNDIPADQRENAAANGRGGETASSSSSSNADAAAAVAATKRRREIQSIMRDATLTDLERRLKIQQLMDGSSAAATVSAVAAVTNEIAIRNNSDGGGIGSVLSSLSIRGNNDNNVNNIMQHNQLIRNIINDDIGDAGSIDTAVRIASNNVQNNDTTTNNNNDRTSSNTSPARFGVDEESEQEAVVSCIHYERKCNIVAPCCQRTFGCRLCHDDIMSHANSNTTKCKIPMDRYAISQIICKACHTLQSSKTNICLHCQTSFAEYHCAICNIWMSNTQHPFHCSKCGMCRVGGSENYKHCDLCGMCLSIVVYESHHCKCLAL